METFNISRTEIVASAGSAASPNLPFGQWSFVENADKSGPHLNSAATRNDATKKVFFYEVVPAGNPNGTKRRVYPSALASDTAEAVLFDGGKLLKGASFGIFQAANGSSIVSADASQVASGIAQAQADYSAKQLAAKAAPKPVGVGI
jgi:hypothetical protein